MQPSRIAADDGARGAGETVRLSLSFLVLSYRRFVEGRLQARLSRYRPARAGPAAGQRRRAPWPDVGADGRGADRSGNLSWRTPRGTCSVGKERKQVGMGKRR